MSKYHCVLDASALLKKYLPENGSKYIIQLFNRSDCALHILNVTIPEITGAFVKWQIKGAYTETKRTELLGFFIADIREYNVVVHNITHRNVVSTDNIWNHSIQVRQPKGPDEIRETECPDCKKLIIETKKTLKPRVGPVDALVLSVAQELKKAYGQSFLFTVDEHMITVARTKLGLKVINPEVISRLSFN